MTRSIRRLAAALVLLLALAPAACDGTAQPAGGATTEQTAVVRDPLPEAERLIGVTDLGDGRVRVVGLLQYRADLDGAWLILEGTPGEEPAAEATVIAWVENMYDLDSACSTKGALVYAEGTLAEDDGPGPGPALTAEFVARADEP